jgi:hypothetical protein
MQVSQKYLCTEGVYTIVDPYGFTKSLFTIASALDFLWGRGMVHCRLLFELAPTNQQICTL